MNKSQITLGYDWNSDANIERVIDELEPNSTPGVPFSHVPNNRVLLEKYRGQLVALVKQRLSGVIEEAFPIRLFVKPEWHKVEKLKDKRFRLIWQVSVVDQVIDRLLVGDLYEKENGNWHTQPSKVGWSYTKGGWRHVPRGIGYDRKGWDISVPPWLLDLYGEYLDNQITAPSDHKIWRRRRFQELYANPRIQLSNGVMFRQKLPGIQKSGSLYTLSGNSVMQVLLHRLVELEIGENPSWIIALGDDTVQPKASKTYLDVINSYVTLKDESENEFCGMHYGFDMEPVYRDKHFLNLAADPTEDRVLGYHYLYGQSKYLPAIKRFNALLGYMPVHQLAIDDVWN